MLGHNPRRWYTVLKLECFNVWRLLRMRTVPQRKRPQDTSLVTSRADRRVMARFGACGYTDVPIKTIADQQAEAVWQVLTTQQHVLWFDNFYRRKFAPTPHRSDRSLNCTAMALLPTVPLPPFPGHPSLCQLAFGLEHVAGNLVASHDTLLAAIEGMVCNRIRARDIRVPLDARRPPLPQIPWRPYVLSRFTTGRVSDLVEVLNICSRTQVHMDRVLPLLVDEKIHYQVAKMLYSKNYVHYDVHAFLKNQPLVYGIWHPYKYAMTLTYRRFFPLFVALIHGSSLPDVRDQPSFPKVRYLENLFAGLLIAAFTYKGSIANLVENLPVGPVPVTMRHKLVRGLHSLLYEYVPAIFMLGFLVRESHWACRSGGTSAEAHKLLQWSLHILVHLTWGSEGSVEYVRTVVVALLMWSEWHSSTPGVANSEEAGEALLGRVVNQFKRYPQHDSFEGMYNLFLMVPRADGINKNLSRGNLQRGLVQQLDNNLRFLVSNLEPDVVRPFIWTSQKVTVPAAEWAPSTAFPVALGLPIPSAHWHDLITKCLHTLATPTRMSPALLDALQRHAGLKNPVRAAVDTAEVIHWCSKTRIPSRYRKAAAPGAGGQMRDPVPPVPPAAPNAGPIANVADTGSDSSGRHLLSDDTESSIEILHVRPAVRVREEEQEYDLFFSESSDSSAVFASLDEMD